MLLLCLVAGAVCVQALVYSRLSTHWAAGSGPADVAAVAYGNEPVARAASSRRLGRPVYRYSVIPGGAYSAEELQQALDSDAVAARHYAVFQRASLRTAPSAFFQPVYVSYRMGDAVYWTRRPVALPPHETLLTDGVNYARARCGNRVSVTPQGPVQTASLPVEVFEVAEPPAPEPEAANREEPLLAAEVFPVFFQDPRWQIAEQAPDGTEDTAPRSPGGVPLEDLWGVGPVWPALLGVRIELPLVAPINVAGVRRGALGLESGSGTPPVAPPDAPPDTPIPEPGTLGLGLIAAGVAVAVRRLRASFRTAL